MFKNLVLLFVCGCSSAMRDSRCVAPFVNWTALNNFCLGVCANKKCDVSRCMDDFQKIFVDGGAQPKQLLCK